MGSNSSGRYLGPNEEKGNNEEEEEEEMIATVIITGIYLCFNKDIEILE